MLSFMLAAAGGCKAAPPETSDPSEGAPALNLALTSAQLSEDEFPSEQTVTITNAPELFFCESWEVKWLNPHDEWVERARAQDITNYFLVDWSSTDPSATVSCLQPFGAAAELTVTLYDIEQDLERVGSIRLECRARYTGIEGIEIFSPVERVSHGVFSCTEANQEIVIEELCSSLSFSLVGKTDAPYTYPDMRQLLQEYDAEIDVTIPLFSEIANSIAQCTDYEGWNTLKAPEIKLSFDDDSAPFGYAFWKFYTTEEGDVYNDFWASCGAGDEWTGKLDPEFAESILKTDELTIARAVIYLFSIWPAPLLVLTINDLDGWALEISIAYGDVYMDQYWERHDAEQGD